MNAWRENRVFSILFLVPVVPVAVKPVFLFVFGINLETQGTRLIGICFKRQTHNNKHCLKRPSRRGLSEGCWEICQQVVVDRQNYILCAS